MHKAGGAIVTRVEMNGRSITAKLLPMARAETVAYAVDQLAREARIMTLTVNSGKERAHLKAISQM